MVAAAGTETSVPLHTGSRPLRRLLRRRGAVAAGVVIALFIAAAVLAPLIAPYDPLATDFAAVRQAPSLLHWLGTDEIGRDVLSRVIWGARISLLAGLVSVAISVLFGVPIGLVSGYAGGWTDGLIMRLTDAMLACPFLILAIAFAVFLGPSLENVMIAIGISTMPQFVRLTRGQVMAVKVEEFVEAAKAVGNSHLRIAVRHVLPNVVSPLVVQATLAIARAIIAEASLSFLGLGEEPAQPSWGSMLNVAKNYIGQAPWMSIWPGLAIVGVVLAFNLLGDGLRDALDPKQR
ncbi:MAG TPA: ABC transporter permease [Candidatus Cybelea sp.]|nr:ABC transporter permease [Candidatus Cybelea sp.]